MAEEQQGGESLRPRHERWSSRVSVELGGEEGIAPWRPTAAQAIQLEEWVGGSKTAPYGLPDPEAMESGIADSPGSFRALPGQRTFGSHATFSPAGSTSVTLSNTTLQAVQPSPAGPAAAAAGTGVGSDARGARASATRDTMAETVSTMLHLLDGATSPAIDLFKCEAHAIFGDGKGQGGLSVGDAQQLGPLARVVIGRWRSSLQQGLEPTGYMS